MDHPELVANKRVLDVGSGCGASAIAAAKCGAEIVIANDICQGQSKAVMFMRLTFHCCFSSCVFSIIAENTQRL